VRRAARTGDAGWDGERVRMSAARSYHAPRGLRRFNQGLEWCARSLQGH
jgi:hypothetical protein